VKLSKHPTASERSGAEADGSSAETTSGEWTDSLGFCDIACGNLEARGDREGQDIKSRLKRRLNESEKGLKIRNSVDFVFKLSFSFQLNLIDPKNRIVLGPRCPYSFLPFENNAPLKSRCKRRLFDIQFSLRSLTKVAVISVRFSSLLE
jgi:hypothetical protein